MVRISTLDVISENVDNIPALNGDSAIHVLKVIDGTKDDDVLSGTTHADIINGLGGNDLLQGQGGDDSIDGGTGNDFVEGGAGDDSVLGGTGADTVFGNTGNDSILAGAGGDEIYGGSGQDTIDGGDGNDALYGGQGSDTVLGGAGDDTIQGGRGHDALSGGDGDDLIYGWNKATMEGDAGTDTFHLASAAGTTLTVSITDYEDGETIDLSDFGFSPDDVTYNAEKHVLVAVSEDAHIVIHDLSGHFGDESVADHLNDGTLVI